MGRLRGGGIEQRGKRIHGHGQQCGDCWGEGNIRGLNGNGKNTIKIKLKNKRIGESFEQLVTKEDIQPWLVWLSGLSAGLQTKGSLV